MTEYKKLERQALSYMYVRNGITMLISAVILLGTARVLYVGRVLGGLPHRTAAAGILAAIWIIIAILLLVTPRIRYRWYRYKIDDDAIDILSGVFVKDHEVVPIERIQKIEASRGPIERHFGLASVTVITAGGNVDVQYLPDAEAEQITVALKAKINEILRARREDGNA